jgi:serine-aspartate repeat-containing protein C/D/E
MAVTFLTTTVHVCEDINEKFDITQLLIGAGYTPKGQVSITRVEVEQNGDLVAAPTPLVQLTGPQTIEVTAANVPNFNGNFSVFTVSVDVGNGSKVYLEIQTVIDPVNDAPSGLDKAIDMVDGSPYILQRGDFGFTDAVENNGFKSVLISALPASGTLLLNGVAVGAGTDISVADIDAGKLTYAPSQNSSGITQFGFQVRDTGGNDDPDCGSSDLDLTPNYITFKVPYASLGDTVFNDDNRNGVQDSGESGVAGVTVTLHGAGADGLFGTADDTTNVKVTDSTGHYQFDQLNAGKYQADFSGIGSDKAFTLKDQGGDDARDSDVDAAGHSSIVTLLAGQTNTTLDAGLVTKLGAIGDYAFLDKNKNGVQDAGDTPFTQIKVTLHGAGADGQFGTADDTTAQQFTDVVGHYQFDNLLAGKYQVEFTNPLASQLSFTTADAGGDDTKDSDINATTGLSQVVNLAAGEINTTVDGGFVFNQGSIGDYVFFDKNGNGVQDAADTGVAGVTVTLKGAGFDGIFGTADDTLNTTTTDSSGHYLFSNLDSFLDYTVKFSGQPSGYAFTARNVGDDALDSDADFDGNADVFTLGIAENKTDIDAGLVAKKGSIGDFVFIDKNGNGVQDAGDTGVAGATVTLKGAGADGVFGTADDTTATTNTDTNGKYLFKNVAGDQDYQVSVSNTPAGYSFTAQGAGGNAALDSDVNASGNTNTFHLGAGEAKTDIDAGLVANTGSIGDFVFIDKNSNGVQDAGEAGVAGAKVTLIGAGVDGVFGTADDTTATTTTDANGAYTFSNVAGEQDYKIAVSNTPVGYNFTAQGAGGNTALDSDVNASGNSNTFHLGAGETRTDIDAGLVAQAGSIGDFVFIDKNGNGVQDAGEAGVSGAKVTLTGAGVDGVFGTADDTTATTTTDANGVYTFSNVAGEQDYKIAVSNTPAGYNFTAQGAGGNTALDSDVNASGNSNTFHLGR